MARMIRWLLIAALCLSAAAVLAQDVPTEVTADDVNAIAKKLYCPVCENIPLDTCGTAACDDWRNEIRLQLEAGMNETEVIADFVRRFGDRVVGTPQDPALAILSLATPWLVISAALVGVLVFLQRHRRKQVQLPVAPPPEMATNPYYDLLRKDVEG